MSYEADALRGKRAQEVLDNEVYTSAYTQIESELVRKWRDSRDKDDREHLHRLLISLDKVKGVMESVMRTGELAAAEVARKKSIAERVGMRRAA